MKLLDLFLSIPPEIIHALTDFNKINWNGISMTLYFFHSHRLVLHQCSYKRLIGSLLSNGTKPVWIRSIVLWPLHDGNWTDAEEQMN